MVFFLFISLFLFVICHSCIFFNYAYTMYVLLIFDYIHQHCLTITLMKILIKTGYSPRQYIYNVHLLEKFFFQVNMWT